MCIRDRIYTWCICYDRMSDVPWMSIPYDSASGRRRRKCSVWPCWICSRYSYRNGHPRNIRHPIITNAPSVNLVTDVYKRQGGPSAIMIAACFAPGPPSGSVKWINAGAAASNSHHAAGQVPEEKSQTSEKIAAVINIHHSNPIRTGIDHGKKCRKTMHTLSLIHI